MIKRPDLCPFCGSSRRRSFFSSEGVVMFYCGTRGPYGDEGDYETSPECDKNCFRESFLRCRAIINRLAQLNSPVIGKSLWEAIVEESKR